MVRELPTSLSFNALFWLARLRDSVSLCSSRIYILEISFCDARIYSKTWGLYCKSIAAPLWCLADSFSWSWRPSRSSLTTPLARKTSASFFFNSVMLFSDILMDSVYRSLRSTCSFSCVCMLSLMRDSSRILFFKSFSIAWDVLSSLPRLRASAYALFNYSETWRS